MIVAHEPECPEKHIKICECLLNSYLEMARELEKKDMIITALVLEQARYDLIPKKNGEPDV